MMDANTMQVQASSGGHGAARQTPAGGGQLNRVAGVGSSPLENENRVKTETSLPDEANQRVQADSSLPDGPKGDGEAVGQKVNLQA
jgi:hypothetical protein